MRKFKIALLLSPLFFFYNFKYVSPEKVKLNLIGYSFIYNVQVINPRDGKVAMLNDTSNVAYDGRYTIYKLPYCRYYSRDSLDQNFNSTNYHQWVEKGTSFLVYNNSAAFGLMYDSLAVLKLRKMPIDSFLKAKMFKDHPFFTAENETLSSKSMKNGVLLTKYRTINQYANAVPDSVYYYFDKNLRDIKYSFSPYLDSLEHSKLFKLKMVYMKKTYKNKDFPAKELVFQIKRNANIKKEVLDFYKKFNSSKENY